jgi:hypothetical protein
MEAVLFPWGFREAQAPGYNSFVSLASAYSASSGYTNLQIGQSYADYPTNGETLDYSYGACGTDALTMEISNNKQPPASQIQNYYQKNVPAMMAMIQNAGYGIEGTVTDSISGLPVKAAIFINNFFPVFTDTAAGDYHKYLPQGVCSLKVVANNYQTKFIDDILISPQGTTVVDIQLHPAVGHYGMKVSAAAIPGNNPMDEANTPAVTGAPDGIFYSAGKSGWIIVDMQDPVINIPGADFTVYEGDELPEGYTCLAGQSIDGPWVSLGTGNGTTDFFLETAGLASTRFIRIVDDGSGLPNVADAGFDLDAVEAWSQPTGITVREEKAFSMKVFPNPAHETVSIEFQNKKESGTVTICNARGMIMLAGQISNGFIQLDIRPLAKGLYFVKLSGEKNTKAGKFIKEITY